MKITKMNRIVGGLIVVLGVSFSSATFALDTDPPKTTDEGLVLKEDAKADLVYMRPEVNWKKYKTIYLRPLAVTDEAKDATPDKGSRSRRNLRESWIIPEKDVALMQREFTKIITEQLEKGGFPVVSEPGENTLIVVASILDVYLAAPIESSRATSTARGGTYTEGGGSITIGAVLADGEDYQVLARAVDTKAAMSVWRKNTRFSNISDMKRAYNSWGKRLAKVLSKAQK